MTHLSCGLWRNRAVTWANSPQVHTHCIADVIMLLTANPLVAEGMFIEAFSLCHQVLNECKKIKRGFKEDWGKTLIVCNGYTIKWIQHFGVLCLVTSELKGWSTAGTICRHMPTATFHFQPCQTFSCLLFILSWPCTSYVFFLPLCLSLFCGHIQCVNDWGRES